MTRAEAVREIAEREILRQAQAIDGAHLPRRFVVTIWCNERGEPGEGTFELDTQKARKA